MIPNKKTARLAGFLWLLMMVFGFFAQIGMRERLIVPGDDQTTASNILTNPLLFRMGFLSEEIMLICYLLTGLALYKLLCNVNRTHGSVMVIFVILGTAIGMLNLLNEYAMLLLLSGDTYLNVFSVDQLKALAMLFYNLYEHGYVIAHFFFSLWVLPLGLLVYKSGFLPRILGIFFMAETVLGLISAAIHFLYPDLTLETNLLWVGFVAELSFTIWLLIRGINEGKVKRETYNK